MRWILYSLFCLLLAQPVLAHGSAVDQPSSQQLTLLTQPAEADLFSGADDPEHGLLFQTPVLADSRFSLPGVGFWPPADKQGRRHHFARAPPAVFLA
ncbi:hypothetical protein GU3_04505 [Oceanimonas sp. GK1]|uniref:hypothetical protein n=1 Tax=Oceanimonas sp. (strain GK1 / IBRC-M 10197) TaxID=511062 RepID=UPI0002494C69|nr:hypothetical protein [Oceanimonas sp. GK1]AEY00658.1 hypothetical protein GU3_04505 [Oceanimonas sp. GK1]